MMELISEAELDQRVREGIVGYWEWVSSYNEQRNYQAAVPLVNVRYEAINQWEHWVSEDQLDTFVEPIFTADEQVAMREFHTKWLLVIDETPWEMPPLEDLIGTPAWERFRQAAEKALMIFTQSGRPVSSE